MTDWVVQARVPNKLPIWLGPFQAEGRADAKRAARLFVSDHLPLDAIIVSIAKGTIKLTIDGPVIPFEGDEE